MLNSVPRTWSCDLVDCQTYVGARNSFPATNALPFKHPENSLMPPKRKTVSLYNHAAVYTNSSGGSVRTEHINLNRKRIKTNNVRVVATPVDETPADSAIFASSETPSHVHGVDVCEHTEEVEGIVVRAKLKAKRYLNSVSMSLIL